MTPIQRLLPCKCSASGQVCPSIGNWNRLLMAKKKEKKKSADTEKEDMGRNSTPVTSGMNIRGKN